VSTAAKKDSRGVRRRLPIGPLLWIRTSTWGRRVLVIMCLLVAGVAAAVAVWRRVRAHVAAQPEYLVSVDDVEITPVPPWIHTDIKAEVIHEAGLNKNLSILDEHVPELLSEAFGLDPWVERVSGVHTSYPAHIRIDLVYRQPVAMVEVPGGLLPVDAQGVLLPTAGFSATEAQNYPRIVGISTSPRGLIGTPWGDASVEQGAKLTALLTDAWPTLGLHHIQSERAADSNSPEGAGLQIVTRQGTVFVWGAAPGEEASDESKAAEKLARLLKLASDYKTLDTAPANQRDLRHVVDSPAR